MLEWCLKTRVNISRECFLIWCASFGKSWNSSPNDLPVYSVQEKLWFPVWVEGLTVNEGGRCLHMKKLRKKSVNMFQLSILKFFSITSLEFLWWPDSLPANMHQLTSPASSGQKNSHYFHSTIYGNVRETNCPKRAPHNHSPPKQQRCGQAPHLINCHTVIWLDIRNLPNKSSIDLSSRFCDVVELFWCFNDAWRQ